MAALQFPAGAEGRLARLKQQRLTMGQALWEVKTAQPFLMLLQAGRLAMSQQQEARAMQAQTVFSASLVLAVAAVALAARKAEQAAQAASPAAAAVAVAHRLTQA